MKRAIRTLVLVLMCQAVSALLIAADETTEDQRANMEWKFGVARVNITPDAPMLMSGYASRETPATGKLTDLWAKALVLEDTTGKRCALITVDLIGIGRRSTELIGRELRARYGLNKGDFSICCSHTHTGPSIGRTLAPMAYFWATPEQTKEIDDYTSALESKIVDVVHKAITNMQPGALAWGNGNASFATNRRDNVEQQVPRLRVEGKLQGPFDHDVPVLAVRDESGTLRSIVFGYACHSTVLSFYQWSGDYPGFAQTELETVFPDCIALFWAGCGADQNPLPRRTVDLARHYGRRLAVAVESVLLTHEMKPLESKLLTSQVEIPLAFASIPTAEQLQEDMQSKDKYVMARATLLQQRLESDGELPDSYSYPVAMWHVGDVDFVFLGGEVVVDYAVRIKHELNGRRTWVAGYSNDVMAYIPSERVLREGGYEGAGAMVYYGLPSAWAVGLEDQIVHAVHDLNAQPAAK